jgi:hypothetical protein
MSPGLYAALFAACAAGQFALGLHDGGWSNELGQTHYFFGVYMLGDVLRWLALALRGAP